MHCETVEGPSCTPPRRVERSPDFSCQSRLVEDIQTAPVDRRLDDSFSTEQDAWLTRASYSRLSSSSGFGFNLGPTCNFAPPGDTELRAPAGPPSSLFADTYCVRTAMEQACIDREPVTANSTRASMLPPMRHSTESWKESGGGLWRSSTSRGSVDIAETQSLQVHSTPQLNRARGSSRGRGGSCNLSAPTSLLYTPQANPEIVALRNQLDRELELMNAARPKCVPPHVTTLVENELYVGGFPEEETAAVLRSKGIQNIINCCAQDCVIDSAIRDEFCVHDMHAFDQQDYLILFHDYDPFRTLVVDILSRGEQVFVHCVAGVNRSVTLCAAYLMERFRLRPVEVVRLFWASGRPRILDNIGFRHQLVDHFMNAVRPQMNEEDEGGHWC